MRFVRAFAIFTFLLVLALLATLQTRAQEPIVYAVLFFSPACPHCHAVMENDLPPLLAEYGDQLQILAVDTTTQSGSTLYGSMLAAYSVPDGRVGVPALLIGQTHLVGSGEIPEQLPGLVATGLAQGGIDLPFIPGLAWPTVPAYGVFLGSEISAENSSETALTAEPESAETDTAGFTLAWIILLGMVTALAFAVYRLIQVRPDWQRLPMIMSLAVPVLVVIGLGVATYLAYVEITHVAAVCGPVGECNRVQSSSYATIAGVPVAVLGLISYAAMGVLWLVQRLRTDLAAVWSRGALLALALMGTLFSIYLTLVELFVIDAVCAWCLTSALVTTALLLVVLLALTPVTRTKQHKPRPKRAW